MTDSPSLDDLHEALERVQKFAEAFTTQYSLPFGMRVIAKALHPRGTAGEQTHATPPALTLEDLNQVIALAEDGLSLRFGPPPREGH